MKKLLLVSVVMLFASLSAGNSFTARSQEIGDGQVLGTCDEIAIELARFKHAWTEWGSNGRDPQSSTRYTSAGGESFYEGITVYRSKSRFKKTVRQMSGDAQGLVGSTPLLDEMGHQIGQRIVKENRIDSKLTSVSIFLITDRMIRGIGAPSLKLALTVEKANTFCRAEAERRQQSR